MLILAEGLRYLKLARCHLEIEYWAGPCLELAPWDHPHSPFDHLDMIVRSHLESQVDVPFGDEDM